MGERWDSNPRQPEPQSGALPTELYPPYNILIVDITTLIIKSIRGGPQLKIKCGALRTILS